MLESRGLAACLIGARNAVREGSVRGAPFPGTGILELKDVASCTAERSMTRLAALARTTITTAEGSPRWGRVPGYQYSGVHRRKVPDS
eukprot:2092200-Rhodomonas_salina.1